MADTHTTKKPTGLQVERSGNDFTFSWKIRDADHGAGQWFQYKTSQKGNWHSRTVTNKQTSITVTLTAADVSHLSFRVKGQRKSYKETVEVNGKNKSITIPTAASAWAEKNGAWVPEKPTKPTVTYTRTGSNTGTFTVEHNADTSGEKIVKYVQYATCVSTNCDKPPKNWPNATSVSGTSDVSREVSYTEQTETISATGLVRWFRARCSGPGGNTDWVYSRHAYAIPFPPQNPVMTAGPNPTQGITVLAASWKTTNTLLRPTDEETMQYAIGLPTDVVLSAPSTGWSDAITVKPSGKKDIVTTVVSAAPTQEQCMWMRIKAVHDENVAYSGAGAVAVGRLIAPTVSATPNFSTGAVSVSLTIGTQCTVARHVIFYRNPKNPKANIPVAILEPGVNTWSGTINAVKGATKSCIGAYAFVGTFSGLSVRPVMISDDAVDEDIAPVAPDALTVTKNDNTSVFLKLSWKWSGATSMEIAWADNKYAWTSNNAPKTCTVTEVGATTWLIQGLEVGKKWYFRGRYHGLIDDDEATSAWSTITMIDLATNPDKPTLTLNRGYVLPGGSISASWNYSNEDESPQDTAQVCLATISGTTVSYGTVLAHADSAQSVMVSTGWTRSTQYYLCVRVRAKSGKYSAWSDPVGVRCPAAPTLLLSNTVLNYGVMTSLSGNAGVGITADNVMAMVSMSITRARDYHVDRPDDGVYDGYEGEIIWTVSENFNGTATRAYHFFPITKEDLLGELDDGAAYVLTGKVMDEYGQTDEKTVQFVVDWDHKAELAKPSAWSDKRLMAVRITPTQPDGYVSGDTFDIYRITADQPELIVQDGTYGTTYVDPYPAFGRMCGHRFVAKTSTGSYITEDDTLAWYDLGYNDGDLIESDLLVIDCNGMQITLPYNIELTNKWQKDFKRTSYLGGSVQGDWNPAILRDLTAKAVIVKKQDTGELMDLRDLAAYAGPAHIRTPDGSSFSCDIQVTEDASYADHKVRYSLSVKGIEPEEPDGMTLEEWQALHPVG